MATIRTLHAVQCDCLLDQLLYHDKSTCGPGRWSCVMFTKGPTVSVMLFTQVAPGDYLLVQTEIVALYQGVLALMLGGVKFHPSSRQIRIGSSQTGKPNQTIIFLGTYDDSDPSVYDSVVYTPKPSFLLRCSPHRKSARPPYNSQLIMRTWPWRLHSRVSNDHVLHCWIVMLSLKEKVCATGSPATVIGRRSIARRESIIFPCPSHTDERDRANQLTPTIE